MTASEFRHYLKKKKERTESSPSGRHIGHYKAILGSDDLVEMVVAMLNIGLATSIALHRWQQTIRVMLVAYALCNCLKQISNFFLPSCLVTDL